MSRRIAHFLVHYPGRDGTAAFCRGLSRALNRIEAGSCPILTFRPEIPPGNEQDELLHYPVRSRHPFHVPRRLVEDLASNRHRLDGMVLHGTYSPYSAALWRVLQRVGLPHAVIPHDPYVPELTRHHAIRKAVFWKVFEKRMLDSARFVQLLDASHERYLRELGCRTPVVTIPNGCEPEMLDELPADARVPGASERVRLLFFGRMDRNHKGLDLLLEGFARARERDPEALREVTLVMTGNDWTDRGQLEELAATLGIADQVEFTGRRPEGALTIVSEADLVILPSRFDGFGLCIVEAMLGRRPVLVSSRAGVADHVRRAGGGWVVEPAADSIADGLLQALDRRKEWPAMGAGNQDYVLRELTWDRVARTTAETYERYFR